MIGMKRKFTTRFLFLFLFIPAFQSILFAQSEVRRIDIASALESKEVVDMTDYFSSIEYIPLGEGQLWIPDALNCNIFYADKENYYFTFNGRKNKACFKFTKDGKYLTSFVDKGTWTHQFISVDDVGVCSENGNIAVCDNNKIMIFNPSGKWVTTIFVGYLLNEAGSVKHFYFDGPDKVCFMWYQESLGKESAVSMDLKGNVICRKVLEKVASKEGRFNHSQVHDFMGELKLFTQCSDTVYIVDENFNKLSAKYVLDFGEYKKGKELWGHIYKNVNLLVNKNIMETDNFIVFDLLFPWYSNKGIEQHRIIDKILYDKNSGKTSLLRYYDALDLKAEGFNNNLDGGAPFLPAYLIGNCMFQFIDAAKFIDLAGKCRSAKMKAVAAKLKPTSNPVMVVAKLK